jgi:hypothetical protein
MEIFQIEVDNGDSAVAVELAMEPYGTKLLYTEDDSEDSRSMLRHISEIWIRLWPEMRTLFEENAKNDLDLEEPVDGDSLIGYAARLKPGIFMSDRCDTYLSLSSDGDGPSWDYFLKDGKIIHFQPVF